MNLIRNLAIKEKIALTEPSKEVSKSYNEKANNSLKASKLLHREHLFEESITMSYYAMYHKATALLRLVGIKSEVHAGTIILLKKLFELDNSKISFAKKERIDKQYYTESKITEKESEELIRIAESFMDELELYSDKLSDINKYREKYESIQNTNGKEVSKNKE